MKNWPLPPFFKDDSTGGEEPLEAMVLLHQGPARHGRLLRFLPESLSLVLSDRADQLEQTLKFSEIKSMQLIAPIALEVDTALVERYREAGGQLVMPEPRAFVLRYTDQEQLRGMTKGFVRTRAGLFIFLDTGGGRVLRIFVPETALADFQVGGLLGQHLWDRGFVKPEQLAQALGEQARRRLLEVDQYLGDAPNQNVQSLASQLGRVGSFASVRLGDILVNQGLVSREQMVEALGRLRNNKSNLLGNVLVEMGAVSRDRLTQAVAEQLNIPLVTLREFVIEPAVLQLVSREFALQHSVLPLLVTQQALMVAVESPVDADYLDELRFKLQRQVIPVIANADELHARIGREYAPGASVSESASIAKEIEQLMQRKPGDAQGPEGGGTQHLVSEDDTLVVRLINQLIIDAQEMGASDIHVEAYPGEQATLIRFRVDGDLTEYMRVPHVLRSALVSRIKIMANMDISEHRLPQDGKIDFSRFAALKLELRVACLPTTYGLQDVVLRLLAASKPIPLDQLGMAPDLIRQLQVMVHRSYGLFLVCGPTGSGKTTTLHSLMAEINTPDNKIWTAEDPIEITHPGLRQIQMIPRIGLTFAAAMRAFLRADPDIIMVGEMRDSETAHIAIEASLTGHLVMSTLHTNSAPESVVRLLDMGLDSFNFSDALIGVLSQRLARKLCPHCKTPIAPTEAEAELLRLAQAYARGTELVVEALCDAWRRQYGGAEGGSIRLYSAKGCERCHQNGYKGRVGIYELMTATPALKKLIQARAPVEQLFKTATSEGMLRLEQYGILKVVEGVTDYRSVHAATT